MAGSPRRASVYVAEDGDLIPAPPGVQAGDVLVAITNGDADISGGNPWVQFAEDDPTRVYVQVAGASNPSHYAVSPTSGGSVLIALVHVRGVTAAGFVAVSQSGDGPLVAPALSPGTAGAVQIRWGYAVLPVSTVWGSGGYTVHDDAATDDGIQSVWVGSSATLSSSDLPAATLPSDAGAELWWAWTILLLPGDYVPPPPPVPAFAARGRALYRYTAHDLLTGDYIDDLYPRDVTYDKRISEPGAFSGSLPIPNSRVARAVRRVIPKTSADLTTGPGRVEIRVWRGGDLWGRYWLTGARISRGRDGKIDVSLRGTTLDGYFYAVRVREIQTYSGDQVANVRSLLQHAQTLPGADIGLLFQTGSSGVSRPLQATKDQGTTYGRAAQEYARTSGGFEYTVNDSVGPTGVESTWVWGYPTLGTGTAHVFEESPNGGGIAEWGIEIDALRGAGTDVEVRGGTPDGDATQDRTPVYSALVDTGHRAAGWPRIDRLIDHPNQSTDPDTLDDYAVFWAQRAGGALWVRTLTVFLGKTPTLTMNSLGDLARQVMSNVWFEREDGGAGLDISERIIGIAVQPPQKGRGKEEVTLVLESEAP